MIKSQEATKNLALVVDHFKTEGIVKDIYPYGSGHIHDTFRVEIRASNHPDYILQRINSNIFKNIPALTENIERVTAHLRKKLEKVPESNPEKEVLTVIPTKTNGGYFKDNDGSYWRMYYFLKDTRSYDLVSTQEQAYQGGRAFGKFQALLADMDATSLHDTIPNFHDIGHRLLLFREAVAKDPKQRVDQVTEEIAFVEEHSDAMATILRLGQTGKIPLRITHNDTKFNNVLLDKDDKAQCVIDLDTVMPGYLAYDFGDAIRTIVNKAPEDEKDLDKVAVDMSLFNSFTEGFLEEAGGFITRSELYSLIDGALFMPFVIGLRFFTDYLDGDNYFKINHPSHNLQRARAQFKLVEKLQAQVDDIKQFMDNMATATTTEK